LSKAQQSNEVYTHLNDSIVDTLLANEDPNLFKAREMLKRVYDRRIYKKVWTGDSEIDVKLLIHPYLTIVVYLLVYIFYR
jgi:hypothetical protein